MSKLFNAASQHGTTANGAQTNTTTLNACLDLFGMAGSSRGENITRQFIQAFAQDKGIATRIALWTRDVRGGAGERQTFRDFFQWLEKEDLDIFKRVALKVPEVGRWDDLLVAQTAAGQNFCFGLIRDALAEENGLCAKWMPRKGDVAVKLRAFLGMSPKQYRKTLVGLTQVVETLMCNKEFNAIDFSKLPSLAAARYQKAFERNAPEEYADYVAKLETGEATINAGAVYPYDVLKSVKQGNSKVANAQWASLPDYLDGSNENILPLVDVSGSMTVSAGGRGSGNSTTCMDVAISLGLYLSERTEGYFKNQFVTFSADPAFVTLRGTLTQRYTSMAHSAWGMNTNFEKVFTHMLDIAQRHGLTQDDLPSVLLVLSDMEFDAATCSGRWSHSGVPRYDNRLHSVLKQKFEDAGYELPKIVYWNLNAREGNMPVQQHETGSALVSGFSPAIMKSVLGAKDFNPNAILLETVLVERYNF